MVGHGGSVPAKLMNNRKRDNYDGPPSGDSDSEHEHVDGMIEGMTDDDEIEERSVYEDEVEEYELPPPMTESEDEGEMMANDLAASEFAVEDDHLMLSSMLPPSTNMSNVFVSTQAPPILDSELSLPYDGPEHPVNESNEAGLTELETAGHTLQEILSIDKFRRWIARDYQRFLTTFTDEHGHSVYHARIRAMCAANLESLEVSYLHLMEANV